MTEKKWNKKLGTSKREQGIITSKSPKNNNSHKHYLSKVEQDALAMASIAKKIGLLT